VELKALVLQKKVREVLKLHSVVEEYFNKKQLW